MVGGVLAEVYEEDAETPLRLSRATARNGPSDGLVGPLAMEVGEGSGSNALDR